MTLGEYRKAIRDGAYAWPGGYPLYFICDDGSALCFDCAKKERRNIISSIAWKVNDGWRVIGVDVNWEDTGCYCAHCSQQIESAYGDDTIMSDDGRTRGNIKGL